MSTTNVNIDTLNILGGIVPQEESLTELLHSAKWGSGSQSLRNEPCKHTRQT